MATQTTGLTPAEEARWTSLVSKGIDMSVVGLSGMVGKDVRVTKPVVPHKIQIKDAPELLGGAEAQAVAVYLQIRGAAPGHMVLVYTPETAIDLVDLLLDQPMGTTKELGEMELSALGEMGNIMGSFFLNTLADTTGLDLQPTPPAVLMDMAGSVLDMALAEIMLEVDELLIVDTVFGTEDRQIHGTFLVLPSPALVWHLLHGENAA